MDYEKETYAELQERIKNAPPLDPEKVKKALRIFNEHMSQAKIEIRRRNLFADLYSRDIRLMSSY